MKKVLTLLLGIILILSSCSTNEDATPRIQQGQSLQDEVQANGLESQARKHCDDCKRQAKFLAGRNSKNWQADKYN
jgi:PBP1b-binding outer membrane lipoprotein LpoB